MKKMFCSTIIPTVGREKLTRAVQSVLAQTFADDRFEIIVVNDSGEPLPTATWHNSPQVTIINTQRRERCIARNSGAAIAKGAYLHFLDDDDWMAPDFLTCFSQLAQREKTAVWLYGATQLVDRNSQPVIQLHHGLSGNCLVQVMAGEWIPLQASLIRADSFFAVGGFHPLIPGGEDVDLLRRIGLHGDFAELQAVVAHLEMGEESSTTDYDWAAGKARWAREVILDEPKLFKRLHQSATEPEWNGRILRLYLTSTLWNIKMGRALTAVNRLLHAIASIGYANTALFNTTYWQAIMHPYESKTFLNGFQAANRAVERRDVTPLDSRTIHEGTV